MIFYRDGEIKKKNIEKKKYLQIVYDWKELY